VFKRKAKKSTWDGTRREFIKRGNIDIWKAKTTKNTYVSIVGMAKKE
jgi:hypothetical protein